MDVPFPLRAALEELTSQHRLSDLTPAADALSGAYRQRNKSRGAFVDGDAQRVAYAGSRMPATYAAVAHVLMRLAEAAPNAEPRTMLDIGTGPGTALWAASEMVPSIESAIAIDADPGMLELGAQLAGGGPSWLQSRVEWRRGDAGSRQPEADLVVASYALNELSRSAREIAVTNAWIAARGWLVIVEPGTPEAFKHLLEYRTLLVKLGGHIIAPCPHNDRCPMASGPSWCHFVERLSRTRTHRLLKHGDLGYEDEKFSYLIAARAAPESRDARIVKHPLITKGFVKLDICGADGLEEVKMTRQDARYREAKKSSWGDAVPRE